MAKAQVEINANKRQELGKKNKKIRKAGLIPAVIYGRKFTPTAVSIDLKEFTKKVMQSEAGHNLIFSINITDDGKSQSVPVITQSIQRDYLSGLILHLDFMHIVMDEAIKTKVPVELVGVPIGVKDSGGILVHGLREIEIKCLPGNIPDKFTVDVAALEINISLHVSDLKLSKDVEILSDPSEMIANVSPPTKEEEVVAAQPTFAAEGSAEGAAAPAAEGKDKAAPAAADKAAATEQPAKGGEAKKK